MLHVRLTKFKSVELPSNWGRYLGTEHQVKMVSCEVIATHGFEERLKLEVEN